MPENKPGPRMFCEMTDTPTGRKLEHCEYVKQAMITCGMSNGKQYGIVNATMLNLKTDKASAALRIVGSGQFSKVINFCPFCGTGVHPNAGDFDNNRSHR